MKQTPPAGSDAKTPLIGVVYQRDVPPELSIQRTRHFEALGLDDV
jgi:hypothetical protein